MEEGEDTTFERTMKAGLARALQRMAAERMVEFEADQEEVIIASLVLAAGEASTPKKMLDALVNTLVDLDEVSEVYADDSSLHQVFLEEFK
ncbi:MAG: hypothetical protein AAGF12_07410 [Myxococcota bacterium]